METITLTTVDPAAPLDDLEPLAAAVRRARVVAIGENAHMVREFYRFRHRLLRFLAERCGFTVFAMESGFSEGLAVDAWTRGGDGDLDALARDHITYTMGRCPEMREHLTWMRAGGLRFFGVDVPGSTASPLSALDGVQRYLAAIDADGAALVDRLRADVLRFASEHALRSHAAYAALEPALRDRITAGFADLAARFDALEVDYADASGPAAYRVARHELRLAALLDQALRSYAARIGGDTAHPKVAARDRGMAETIGWLLDTLPPDTRIVLGAHNSHIQRTPVRTPAFALSAMGHHLAHRLGDEYLTIAVTATAGTTSSHRADPDSPSGVAIAAAPLDPPVDGSAEAAYPPSTLTDLRPLRGEPGGPDRIRIMDVYQEAPITAAYDFVANLPHITTTEQVTA
ncbi:erythromycin esterase family protein [Dactylosporangium matsuzakiense]|uniref:Erythromycin esterase n=1 Tax=Dactylosporangium matsuzakiense TaxID=53360 RepID=A0A9W6KU44_9ACTN|nr:erythromycin esterase family protein [Dactylosporangium matsuzakiense]UWZ49191.1 erythromycin esterase family protein [Dactylosporangium matsuzakiense]GLL06739.1 erythromycin esterase [Dactylosporangium matsuzakiense]